MKIAMCLIVVFVAGCGTMPLGSTPLENSLRADVLQVCGTWTNGGREEAVVDILTRDKVRFKTHDIGWYTPRVNIEANGPANVLFTCHVDCTDGITNPFRLFSHGVLDFIPPMSSGAVDSGGAVAVGLELARRGHWVLFTGLHEAGALGARSFAEDMEELPKLVVTLGLLGGSVPERAMILPIIGISDHEAFDYQCAPIEIFDGALANGPWGLIPRKGWLHWRGTETALVVGPPDFYAVDQLFYMIGSLGFLVAPPITRYHGLLDQPFCLEPKYLAKAVTRLETIPKMKEYN